MSRFATIALSVSFVLVGLLFFASGYMMSRGLLHAQLPQFGKQSRSPSFDVNEMVSTQRLTDLSEEPDDFAFNSLESLSGMFSKKVTRTPSSSVAQKRYEPLTYSQAQYVIPFRWMR
ncbi:MAG: hypothetical protein LBJ89_03010 [Holosporales bacterium]|jgi:hypothetical protein|nr:hypothetical protein [Holosporales bacterium]